MKIVFELVVLCTVVVYANPVTWTYNEIPANIQTYPWSVYLIGSNDKRCGGSIISPNFVLSSAMCCESLPITIIFGTNNFSDPFYTRTATDEHIIVNKHSNRPLASRLVLIRVENIILGLTIQPIRLPNYAEIGLKSMTNYMTYLPSFGDTTYGESELLWLAYTKIVVDDECIAKYDPDLFTTYSICGDGYRRLNSGSCIGNEGAPLILLEDDGAPTQIGVMGQANNECITPSVYTSIEYDLDWIYDTTDAEFRF